MLGTVVFNGRKPHLTLARSDLCTLDMTACDNLQFKRPKSLKFRFRWDDLTPIIRLSSFSFIRVRSKQSSFVITCSSCSISAIGKTKPDQFFIVDILLRSFKVIK